MLQVPNIASCIRKIEIDVTVQIATARHRPDVVIRGAQFATEYISAILREKYFIWRNAEISDQIVVYRGVELDSTICRIDKNWIQVKAADDDTLFTNGPVEMRGMKGRSLRALDKVHL